VRSTNKQDIALGNCVRKLLWCCVCILNVLRNANRTRVCVRRPKLAVDEQGQPTVLYTGVCPSHGLCYTHAQPLKQL
jgi:hypothetical protein